MTPIELPRFAGRPVVAAALWAGAAVVAVQHASWPGGALVAAAGLVWCALARCCGAGLLALPAALGAFVEFGPPAPIPELPLGPVWLRGEVLPAARAPGPDGSQVVLVRSGRCELPCRVHGAGAELLQPGDRVSGPAFASLEPEPGAAPWLSAQAAALSVEPGPPTPRRIAEQIRARLEQSLLRAVGGEAGRLLCHLVLGSGPTLPDDLVAAHRTTGVAHLLAVSGAHASMLAWMLGVAYRAVRGNTPWASRAYRCWCLVLLAAYGAITGWEPPVFRALCAHALIVVASATGRRTPLVAVLALPALATALLAPRDFLGPSFCLSYAAVVGLALAGVFDARALWRRFLWLPLIGSVWAACTTAPLTLHWFGQIAPWTILATPLLGPLVGAMLGLGVLTALLGVWLPGPAAMCAVPLEWLGELYASAVRACAELPGAPVPALARPTGVVLGACALAGAIACAYLRGRRGALCLVAATTLPYFVVVGRQAPPAVDVLSVGHGLATLVRLSSGATLLVDCGSLADPRRAAIAVDKALGAGRRTIDALVLSHGDADHAAGVPELAARLPIRDAWLPDAMREHRAARALRRHGARLHWLSPGGAATPLAGVQVWAPDAGPDASRNDSSLWVRVDQPGASFLLPGDAGARGIAAWLPAHAGDAAVDVLVLPHHGRVPDAAGRILLEACRPRAAIVSNRRGELLTPLGEQARRLGIEVWHTGARGRVTVRAGRTIEIDCERPARLPPREPEPR